MSIQRSVARAIFGFQLFGVVIAMAILHGSPPPSNDSFEHFDAKNDEKPIVRELIEDTEVFLTGIFDTTAFDWGMDLFNFTVALINDHSDGWFDDVLNDGTILTWDVADSACASSPAARAYWDLRTQNNDQPMHGIVGCRCSGASISVATIASLEGVPQISSTATSSKLSNDEEFPYFSRMVAPDDASGMVGALTVMLRQLGWQTVSLIYTDTPWGGSMATEFQNLWPNQDGDWQGTLAYSHSLKVLEDNLVDENSIREALGTMSKSVNSRVILLFAHNDHAYQVLETAAKTKFRPDSVWIGTDIFVSTNPQEMFEDISWIPSQPGYLSIVPFRSSDLQSSDFVERFQRDDVSQRRNDLKWLSSYAAQHMIDSILAFAMAFSSIPYYMRRNGTLVTQKMRNLAFDGMSGRVEFTENGDRKNPRYSLFNLQQESDGMSFTWIEVGSAGLTTDGMEWDLSKACFPKMPCGVIPPDMYPIRLQTWIIVTISLMIVLLLAIPLTFVFSRRKYKKQIDHIDSEIDNLKQQISSAEKREIELMKERFDLQERPDSWSDTDEILVEVTPDDKESAYQYWAVLNRMRESMPNAHISKLWRIQNASLWSSYSFQKKRLQKFDLTGQGVNEKTVFHGTRGIDPSCIYLDRHHGFMTQFSSGGLWGRGLYFAKTALCSHTYSYKPACSEWIVQRDPAADDEHEILLAKLLAGDEIFMDHKQSKSMAQMCRSLVAPPINRETGERYSCVTGITQKSKVWIVYDNGKAYPEFLIRYYRGKRDPHRTPYISEQHAFENSLCEEEKCETTVQEWQEPPRDAPSISHTLMPGSRTMPEVISNELESGGGGREMHETTPSSVVWEYRFNRDWMPYSQAHQKTLEDAYQRYLSKVEDGGVSTVQINTDQWQYEVDVKQMVQTNVKHENRKQRRIRRKCC